MDQFRNDQSPMKTDLMVGVYKTDEGKAYVLPSVKKVGSDRTVNRWALHFSS